MLRFPPNLESSSTDDPAMKLLPYGHRQRTFKTFSDEEKKNQAGIESLPKQGEIQDKSMPRNSFSPEPSSPTTSELDRTLEETAKSTIDDEPNLQGNVECSRPEPTLLGPTRPTTESPQNKNLAGNQEYDGDMATPVRGDKRRRVVTDPADEREL